MRKEYFLSTDDISEKEGGGGKKRKKLTGESEVVLWKKAAEPRNVVASMSGVIRSILL